MATRRASLWPGLLVMRQNNRRALQGRLRHLQLVQPQAPVLHLEQQLCRQCAAELAQWVLVFPQPQLERLRCQCMD